MLKDEIKKIKTEFKIKKKGIVPILCEGNSDFSTSISFC
jgi:hypothetical protein